MESKREIACSPYQYLRERVYRLLQERFPVLVGNGDFRIAVMFDEVGESPAELRVMTHPDFSAVSEADLRVFFEAVGDLTPQDGIAVVGRAQNGVVEDINVYGGWRYVAWTLRLVS